MLEQRDTHSREVEERKKPRHDRQRRERGEDETERHTGVDGKGQIHMTESGLVAEPLTPDHTIPPPRRWGV